MIILHSPSSIPQCIIRALHILQGSPDAGSWEASGSSAHVWVPAGSSESSAVRLGSLRPAGAACPVQTNPHGSRSASRARDGSPKRPAACVPVPDRSFTYVSHLKRGARVEKRRRSENAVGRWETGRCTLKTVTHQGFFCSSSSRAGGVGAWAGEREGFVGGGEERRRAEISAAHAHRRTGEIWEDFAVEWRGSQPIVVE